MRRSLGFALLAVLGLAAEVAIAAAPPTTARAVADPARVNTSVSAGAARVPRDVRAARTALRADLGLGAVMTADTQTGALKNVGRVDDFLTGSSGREPREVALGWVREHRDALGLDSGDLASLRLVRDYRSADGVTHLVWQQVVDGIPAVDSDLRANIGAKVRPR